MRLPRNVLTATLLLTACGGRPVVTPKSPAPDTLRTAEVARGVTYEYRWYREGPWAVHSVTFDPKACGIELRSFKAGDHVFGRENTSAMAQRAAERYKRPVLAAINADFFSYTPPGVSEGPQVMQGRVLKSAGVRREAVADKTVRLRPVFAYTSDGHRYITIARLRGTVGAGSVRVPLAGLNVKARADSAFVFDSFWGDATPVDTGALEIAVRNGSVVSTDTLPAGVAIPADGYVVAVHGAARAAFKDVRTGEKITLTTSFDSLPANVSEMLGGYPMLLRRGKPVYDLETGVIASFAQARHPRSVIGWGKDRRMTIMVVDGRRKGYSAGMSLKELSNYLLSLGITEAMNFDGGGSSTLIVNGRLANLPSDSASERLVSNALLVLGPKAGQCK